MSIEPPSCLERDDIGRQPQDDLGNLPSRNALSAPADAEASLDPESPRIPPPDLASSLPMSSPNGLSDNIEVITRSPQGEEQPSTSHRFRQPSYDRSDMINLNNTSKPSSWPSPQMGFFPSSYPERGPFAFDSGMRVVPDPPRESTQAPLRHPQPEDEPSASAWYRPNHDRHDSFSRHDNAGVAFEPSVPPPLNRQMPQATYSQSMPHTSWQIPEPYPTYSQSMPQPARQMPSNTYDTVPQFAPMPSRETPTGTAYYPSQAHLSSRPYPTSMRIVGTAFVANDPFRPGKGKNESDKTYNSFDDIPTDLGGRKVPYVGRPSRPPTQQRIRLPTVAFDSQPHVILTPGKPSSRPATPPPPPPSLSPTRFPRHQYAESEISQPISTNSSPSAIPDDDTGSDTSPVRMGDSPLSLPSVARRRSSTSLENMTETSRIRFPHPIRLPRRPIPPPPQPMRPPRPMRRAEAMYESVHGSATTSESSNESTVDPNVPIPSEYPNGYGPYFQEHGIDIDEKKKSFRSIRELLTWIFSHPKPRPSPDTSSQTPILTLEIAGVFITKTLPTQIYLHVLLRLPSLYFSRVSRIFVEADLTLPQLKRMALETASKEMAPDYFYALESTMELPPEYTALKQTWEAFIDSVMREWKTFNIISVLLLSAILTILQIQSAAQDPIIRYTALASLICALISLLFGCMYIIRFGTMRKTYKAAEWALEAKQTKTIVWWNVWVLLAMPVIWLVWSIILYIACIMTFIWRTSSQDVAAPLIMSKTTLLVIRVVLSAVLALGIVYASLIMNTFRRYGEMMDNAWKERIRGWIESKGEAYILSPQPPTVPTTYTYLPSYVQPYPPGYPADPQVYPSYRGSPIHVQPVPVPDQPPMPVDPQGSANQGDTGPVYVQRPSKPSTPPPADLPPEIYEYYARADRQQTPYGLIYGEPSFISIPPPSVREELENPSRRNSENSTAPSSVRRTSVPSHQPPIGQRRTQSGSTGVQSSNRETSYDTSRPSSQVPPADSANTRTTRHRRVSIPPPNTLPTIPGTPGTGTLSYISPVYTDSPTENTVSLPHEDGISTPDSEGVGPMPEERRRNSQSRVQFRSPMFSESAQFAHDQGMSHLESQHDLVDISGVADIPA